MKTGTRQFFTPSYIDTVDFKKSTAENTKNLKSIRYGVIFKSTRLSWKSILKHGITWTTERNIKFHQRHPWLLVEGKQRARHYYRQGDVMRSREGGLVQALVALVLEHAGTSPTSV